MKTPLTAQLLTRIAADLSWTHSEIARLTKISQSTVTRHLTGERDINDEHFAAYVHAVPVIDKPRVLAAWLRDALHPDDVEYLLDAQTGRIQSEVTNWLPDLPGDLRQRVHWLSEQMMRDPDLQSLMTTLTKKFGFKPPPAE